MCPKRNNSFIIWLLTHFFTFSLKNSFYISIYKSQATRTKEPPEQPVPMTHTAVANQPNQGLNWSPKHPVAPPAHQPHQIGPFTSIGGWGQPVSHPWPLPTASPAPDQPPSGQASQTSHVHEFMHKASNNIILDSGVKYDDLILL